MRKGEVETLQSFITVEDRKKLKNLSIPINKKS